ncbi:hypothetical protein BOX15_Mlig023444g1 [Macrostomum lignano]|uniref:Carbonic anhydrase n=2 Tax=Macrostomum lignano TaxID=282301 RepID=A0A267HA34_9PLAT|nr:hypothetical protein BOX15_Mlig023444g1 [Macrostomum lignano]
MASAGSKSWVTMLSLLVAAQLQASLAAGGWDYGKNGPNRWAELFPKFCAGDKQSPIDLSTQTALQNSLIRKYVFHQSSIAAGVKFTLKNDGHKIELNWSPELSITMGQTAADQMYTAAQLHWHWGSSDQQGSEHTLDKKSYAAEGHLVFYNSKDYANISMAASRPNGLAVLGVFYEVSANDNPLFKDLEKALANDTLINMGGAAEVAARTDFNMFSTFLPSNQDEFFRYDGSLTTPVCYESVLWTVYRQAVPISARQLQMLRRLHYSDNSSMVNNFRPPLPLNPGNRPGTPRTLYRTFSAGAAGLAPSALSTVGLILAALLAGRLFVAVEL